MSTRTEGGGLGGRSCTQVQCNLMARAQTGVHSTEQSLVCCCNKFPTECAVSLEWNALRCLLLPAPPPSSCLPVSFCALMPSPQARIHRSDYKKGRIARKSSEISSIAPSKMFVFQPRLNLISFIWELLSFLSLSVAPRCLLLRFTEVFPAGFLTSPSVAPRRRRVNEISLRRPAGGAGVGQMFAGRTNAIVVTPVGSSGSRRIRVGRHPTGVPQGRRGLSPSRSPILSDGAVTPPDGEHFRPLKTFTSW